ncbi:11165_t:CDS:2 [Funneliformis mosseae]|uniref:11165_t:CDS:1 n=1 Tax=Funneliformis mosseae TaxID=27381 RepID=A0A9N9H9X7_FUNMO|nr:11165_t:CDS:2 [Funneliformis mosseae]
MVGKTLTTVAISEFPHRSMLLVFEEAKLSRVLEVENVWNAIILVDESDIFLEHRSKHDIERNALVSTFLRLLEYHQGILFLITNRVQFLQYHFQISNSDFNQLEKVPDELSVIITYCERLRDVLLEGNLDIVDDSKQEFFDILVSADRINSPVRKQRLPELQIFDFRIINFVANIQEPDYENKSNSNEPHYIITLNYSCLTKLDNVESDKIKVDDNNSALVIELVKQIIRNFGLKCEFNDKSIPNYPENFKLGTNNVFQDANLLSQALINYSLNDLISCIQGYEN